MESLGPLIKSGSVEKVLIVFTHDASGVIHERYVFTIKECLVKDGNGVVDIMETKQVMNHMLMQIIFCEHKLPPLREGCSFSIQVHTYERSDSSKSNGKYNKNVWCEIASKKIDQVPSSGNTQVDDNVAMTVTPIRTIEASLLHLELVVESLAR